MGCADISIGTGEIWLARRNVGFLSGEVKYAYKYDIKKFKTGVPKTTRCTVTNAVEASLKGGMAEIGLANLSAALGGLDITAQVVGAVTVDDAANEEHTFIKDSLGVETIQLGPGPFLAKDFASLVVENQGETVTYTGTGLTPDYSLNAATGVVTRIAAGTIPSGATVRVNYACNTIAGKKMPLGAKFSLEQVPLTFVHTKPNTTKRLIIHSWLASVSGTIELGFNDNDFIVNNIEWEIIDDRANHPLEPFGYVFDES